MNNNNKDNQGDASASARRASRFLRLAVMNDITDSNKGTKDVFFRVSDVEHVEVRDGVVEIRVGDGGIGKLFTVESAERDGGRRRPLRASEITAILEALGIVDSVELSAGEGGGRLRVKA